MPGCQRCGEPNATDSRFCVNCGGPLLGPSHAGAGPNSGREAGQTGVLDAPGPGRVALATDRPESGLTGPRAYATTALPIGDSPVTPLQLADGAPQTLVGFLVSFETNPLGDSWRIFQGTAVIGRLGPAGAAVELPHPTVSSVHAQLLAATSPGRVQLVDVRSTNGTYVNEVLLQPGIHAELRDGDSLRFGLFRSLIKIL